MTVADIEAKLAQIEDIRDDERAHVLEDDMREAVLKAIAAGAPNPTELAAAALRSSEIKFCRWYA